MGDTILPQSITVRFKERDDTVFEAVERTVQEMENLGQDKLGAVRYLEDAVFAGREFYPKNNALLQDTVQTLVLKCNKFSVYCMEHGDMEAAHTLLNVADQHTGSAGYIVHDFKRLNMRAITMNNFGCYYRRLGKLHTAIQYLEKALKIESANPQCHNPAGTHLNICAILSELDRHRAAADHAKCAVQLLKYQLVAEKQGIKHERQFSATSTSILSIAYFNWGAELEHLKQYDGALGRYKLARTIAEKADGNQEALLSAIASAIHQIQPKAFSLPKLSMDFTEQDKPYNPENVFPIVNTPRVASPRSIRRQHDRYCTE